MAWITPKTDWVATDPITYVDYNRIINNLKYIQDLCKSMYNQLVNTNLGADQIESDVPYADMLNNIENCLDNINRVSYNFNIGRKKSYSANRPYIDYNELNRVESVTLTLYEWLDAQKVNIPTLSFTLGNYRGIRV